MSAASSAALEWSWYRLFEAPGEAPSWLTEVRELRARVIFANGQRPAFGSNGARQGDRDEIDFYSTHIVARLRGAIAGCVRLTPLVASLPSVTEQMIGKAKLRELLATLGADASKTVEHGRWVADPAYKQLGTGVYLMAASFAVAYKLGFPFSVATATSGVVTTLGRFRR
jgi:N-acyl-L-homoserine lactone synthetase